MNIEALIQAAKEIDRKATLQEQRHMRLKDLEELSKNYKPDSLEYKRIQREGVDLWVEGLSLDVDIAVLRAALRG